MGRPAGILLVLGLVTAPAVAGPLVIGEERPQVLETPHPYGLGAAAGSRAPAEAELVWSATLHDPTGTYITPHFSRFELGEGDHVIVRSPDGQQSWRYEGLGRAGLGTSATGFWSSIIRGDTAIVELYATRAVGGFGFSIDRFARGLTEAEIMEANGLIDPPPDTEAICGTDDADWAKCYEDTEPEVYEQARAVARLIINGSGGCTGWLVGCEGHLMTNNHCIANQSQASNTDYEFMAQGATCTTPCFSFGACPGTIEATSGSLVKTNVGLDYTIVALPEGLTDTYGFMRIREEGPVVGERIYIPQHAAAWGKRIAVFSTHAQDQSGFCEVFNLNSPPCTGGPGDVGYHCDTQGGSSGSPVLAYEDHRVVALHHCANCPNRGLNIIDVVAHAGSDLPACAFEQLAGELTLDRAVTSCNDVLTVSVRDDNLGAGEDVVALSSSTEPAPELLTLAPADPGTYTGTMALDGSVDPAPGDGILSVSHADTVTVEYIDADDGEGGTGVVVQTTLSVDCVAPDVTGIGVGGLNPTSATVSWTTSEPADGSVSYGTSGPGPALTFDEDLVTQHSAVLSGLQQCTEVFFSITSADEAGNAAVEDNGGGGFVFESFCTPPSPLADGSGSSQAVRIGKSTGIIGGQVLIYWDPQCAPPEANILYGPLGAVSTYTIGGSICSVPMPFQWNAMPDDIWFVVVGDNGLGVESSWGQATSGERNGLEASGQCGTTVKNLEASCP